jgi:hypothetical protein
VDAGGSLYDVEFVDGNCQALFNGCNDSSDFLFPTASDANAASQALLDLIVNYDFAKLCLAPGVPVDVAESIGLQE